MMIGMIIPDKIPASSIAQIALFVTSHLQYNQGLRMNNTILNTIINTRGRGMELTFFKNWI